MASHEGPLSRLPGSPATPVLGGEVVVEPQRYGERVPLREVDRISPSSRSPVDPAAQRLRKIENQIQNESAWLQKLLFALGKAEDARAKLAATQEAALSPLVVLKDGTPVPLGLVAQNVKRRVEELMKILGQGARGLPS